MRLQSPVTKVGKIVAVFTQSPSITLQRHYNIVNDAVPNIIKKSVQKFWEK